VQSWDSRQNADAQPGSESRRKVDHTGRERAEGGQRKRRVPRVMTPARLERIAVAHLQRHASSVENLRRVLRRRIARSCTHHDRDPAELEDPLSELLVRLERAGLLDDRRYGASLVRTARARGASRREIESKLRFKGIDPELARALTHDEGDGDPEKAETEAAWRYARRRRLGPYRNDPETRLERRQRDLAALGRRGFGYGIACQVVDGDLDDEPGAA